VVAAPGKIERPAADKVKTDQRDAERVLRLLMIDGLHPVRVPSGQEEALRDVVRAREAVRGDLMRARQRLSKLLLRHDVRYEETASAWTVAHRGWLTKLDLGERGAQITLLEYLGAIDAIVIRRDALEKIIAELIPGSPWERTVARLRCLRGIDTLSAVGLCAEVGDFERFQKAGQLMSYVGLTPSEDTSGEKRRLGSITKTGSRHARRLLVEAAWHYRRAPAKGQALRRRQDGQPVTSSRSPGKRNDACITSGNGSIHSAASAARSLPSPSPGADRLLLGTRKRRLTAEIGRSSPPSSPQAFLSHDLPAKSAPSTSKGRGLENRHGRFRPSGVRIPPSPYEERR